MTKPRVIIPEGKAIIRQDKAAQQQGRVTLAEIAIEKPQSGSVVYTHDDSNLEVGDRVIFGKYAGAEFEFRGEKFLSMKEEDIILIERAHDQK